MEPEGKTYGYARVSSRDQNLDRQLRSLKEFPVEETCIFTDKSSGKDFNRPGYRRLLRTVKQGDTLVIKSIDRLGRSYDEIHDQWRFITRDKGVHVVVLDMPLLDTRVGVGGITGVFLADMVLQILSYVAQLERENIKQRQSEGIKAAQSRGVRFGRPELPVSPRFQEVYELCEAGGLSKTAGAKELGVSRQTFYKWIEQFEKTNNIKMK